MYSIYKSDGDEKYWDRVTIDILTPLQKCDKMLAIPCTNVDSFANVDSYILNYISRCLRFLKKYPDYSIWVPSEYTELEYFDFKFNPVPFYENTACWAKEVVGIMPGSELGREDIDALRSIYPAWIEKPVEKTCSIVIGSTITETIAEAICELFTDWSIRFVYNEPASYDSLIGSALCIFANDTNKLWALPIGCRVIEFQQELDIRGEFQHLAHISGFQSWVLLLAKGNVQEQIIEQLRKWTKNF